jgi:hypothetical protein
LRLRTKSWMPNSRSSAAICRLSPDCDKNNCSAAFVKFKTSAAARKHLICEVFIDNLSHLRLVMNIYPLFEKMVKNGFHRHFSIVTLTHNWIVLLVS